MAALSLLIHRENSGSCPAGTDVAILYESSAPSPPTPPHATWGGARNRASRESDRISLIKAVELVEATRRAIAIGLPFNRHLTIHWAKAGLTDAQAAAATGRMLKLCRDWVRKRGGDVAHIWVRENGPGKGSHVHILLHLPAGVKLGGMTARWYKIVTGWRGRAPGGAVKTERIGGSARSACSGSDWYEANLAWLVAYLLKGVDPATANALGLARQNEGGRIIGKRVAASENLGRTFRKARP